MDTNTNLLKSIQTMVQEQVNSAPYDKTRNAIVLQNYGNGYYKIRLDGVEYNKIQAYGLVNSIVVNSTVKVIIPGNQSSQMFIMPINISGGGSGSAVWGQIGGDITAQQDLQAALNAKQNTISDLADIRSGATLGATSYQNTTAGTQELIENIEATDTFYLARNPSGYTSNIGTITEVQANGTTIASSDVANIPAATTSVYGVTELVDDVTNTSTTLALTANQGKILNDRINAIANIGRFLAIWDCTTGLPTSQPSSSPYTYHTGDYFRLTNITATATDNLIPNGASYTIGVASTTHFVPTATEPNLQIGDVYFYDGTSWVLEPSGGHGTVQDVTVDSTSVVSGGVANITLGNFGITADSTELNYTDGVTSNIQTQLDNKLSKSENTGISVTGTTTDTTTLGGNKLVAPNGVIISGTAAEAGLTTRGICGATSPSSTGACTKDSLYINYDGIDTYNTSRHMVLQAGSAGTHYGNNLYQYCVPRGDIVKNWVEAKGYTTNTGTVTSVGVEMNGTIQGTITTSGTIDLGNVIVGTKVASTNPDTYIGYNSEGNSAPSYVLTFKGNDQANGLAWSSMESLLTGSPYNFYANKYVPTALTPSAAIKNGFYYVNSTTVDGSTAEADANPFYNSSTHPNADFKILVNAYNDSWLQQIATDFRSGDIYMRRKESGTWTKWAKIIAADTSGNVYLDNCLFGPTVGSNPRNRYDSGLYFFNCNASTTSTYNFGLYQWNDVFQFTTRTSSDNVYRATAFEIDGNTGVTDFKSTPTLNGTALITEAPMDSKQYARQNGAWTEVSGSGGSSYWGGITGTLSNQADLQSALDAKASLSGAVFTGNIKLSGIDGQSITFPTNSLYINEHGGSTYFGVWSLNGTPSTVVGAPSKALVFRGNAVPKFTSDGSTYTNVALTSDIPTNYVTTDTDQTVSGKKSLTNGLAVSGRYYGSGDDEGIVVGYASNNYAGVSLGGSSGSRMTIYHNGSTNQSWFRHHNGTSQYDIYLPDKAGTVALTSDVPTNVYPLEVKTYTISSRSWASGGTWLADLALSPSWEGYTILDVMCASPSYQSQLIPVITYSQSASQLRGFVRNLSSSALSDSVVVHILCQKTS